MKIIIISLLLACAAFFAPLKGVDAAARVLVPAVALMATGIFPCMSLAVGAMKGEHRTPALVDQLYTRLRKVLMLLVVTFTCAVAAVASLALTSALVAIAADGNPHVDVAALTLAAHASAGAAALILALLGGRVVDLGRAFFAILDINRRHALLIARAKVSVEEEKAVREYKAAPFKPDSTNIRVMERA